MAKSINMLRDLSRRSEEAISRLVTKDGKTKAGRNKAEAAGPHFPQDLICRVHPRGMEVKQPTRSEMRKSLQARPRGSGMHCERVEQRRNARFSRCRPNRD
jgi:hypothetical protein